MFGDENNAHVPDHMKPGAMPMVIGWVMMLIGIVTIYFAFTMETSVEVSASILDVSTLDRVNNTGLMQQQLMRFLAGIAIAFGGLVTILAGALARVISNRAHP